MPEQFKEEDKLIVMLDIEDFKKLVSGGIVRKEGVSIALKDIGYDYMIQIIQKLKES